MFKLLLIERIRPCNEVLNIDYKSFIFTKIKGEAKYAEQSTFTFNQMIDILGESSMEVLTSSMAEDVKNKVRFIRSRNLAHIVHKVRSKGWRQEQVTREN